jgi:hypothetical protein
MGGFGQVMKTMMNWQPSGSPAWQRQQQQKVQQAQEDRAAQQADIAMHEHLVNEIGALPVVHGMVKEQQQLTAPAAQPPDQIQQSSPAPSSAASGDPSQSVDPALTRGGYTPAPAPSGGSPVSSQQIAQQMTPPWASGDSSNMLDAQGNPNPGATAYDLRGPAAIGDPGGSGSVISQQMMRAAMPGPLTGNVTIVRKADPQSTVSWKDHQGNQVQYELPSPDSQRWNQMMRLRTQSLQQQSQAEAQGKLDAQNQQREQYGTPLSGDLAQQYGVDPDQKFLPMEKVQLATRYFPVVGAGVRGNATVDAAGLRAAATNYKTDLDSTTKQAIADQASMDRQDALDHRDKWQQAIVAAKNSGQSNLDARAFLAGSSRDMALHTALLGDISKESQRQMLAQSLLAAGPDGQPLTKDGDQFPDPFSGRTMTMNVAQRIRLKSALNQSQSTVAGYQNAAADLESRRDQILNRFGAPAGNGSSPLLWRGSGPAPPGSVPAPAGGSSDAPAAAAPTGPSSNVDSSAPAAGPGSANWAPRGRGVQKVADYVNAASRAAAAPHTPPSGRPANWADAARAEVGSSAALPGRAAPTPTAGAPAKPQAKVASNAQVQVYAQKKGITPAAALKEFQDSGYTVQ